ncbi:hypothetical protein, partial [uncultured Dialister sp.]|uniref:hypothetical protein n=1 Tax=uncultured Dialister sp. TaxID=278064 RepID=UPI0025E3C834
STHANGRAKAQTPDSLVELTWILPLIGFSVFFCCFKSDLWIKIRHFSKPVKPLGKLFYGRFSLIISEFFQFLTKMSVFCSFAVGEVGKQGARIS